MKTQSTTPMTARLGAFCRSLILLLLLSPLSSLADFTYPIANDEVTIFRGCTGLTNITIHLQPITRMP